MKTCQRQQISYTILALNPLPDVFRIGWIKKNQNGVMTFVLFDLRNICGDVNGKL